MSIKPWYKVATPREDLREGKPLDAAEFAVHLDHSGTDGPPKTARTRSGFSTGPISPRI
jgi:hypothetical protein